MPTTRQGGVFLPSTAGMVHHTTCRRGLIELSLARDRNDEDNRNRSVRTVGQSSQERELRQMRYEEEEDEDDGDEYYYEDDEEDEDDYSNDRNQKEEDTGNFWTNPLGRMDINKKSPPRQSQSQSQPQRERGREREREQPLKRGSQRKTFRSGNPPPPNIMRDLYDKIFWYGFDPEETTSSADRTMFGGTKGKFNGLGLLQDIQEDPRDARDVRDRRGVSKEQPRKRVEYEDDYNDEYDEDDEDEEYEDDIDAEYDNEDDEEDEYEIWEEDEVVIKRTQRVTSRGKPTLSRDRPSLPPQDANVNENQSRPSRTRSPLRTSNESRPRRSAPERRSRSGPPRERKSITSAWFDEEDDSSSSDRNRRSKRSTDRYDDDDDDDTDTDNKSQTSPLINILDKVFQVDPDEVKYQADDYNRKLGLDKKKRTRATKQNRGVSKQRKGYAYRYVRDEDEDDDGSTEEERTNDVPADGGGYDDIIDVEATVQTETRKNKVEQERKPKQQSWEDRASAYERVPPKGIKAWGPEGLIDGGIDARTYAAQCAMAEIEKATGVFEKKEQLVTEAEQVLIELKRNASTQKKKILEEDDRRKSSMIRDRLRMINFDIEDSARTLRRAKGEALAAIDKLELIELRHWALLRQYEADQELEKVLEASKDGKIDESDQSTDSKDSGAINEVYKEEA